MNALKITKSGLLWKLALRGGMPADGMVTDKANAKYNRLIRAQCDAGEISYAEMSHLRRDPERPIDFCDFTRSVLVGCLFWFLVGCGIAAVGAFVVGPALAAAFGGLAELLGYAWNWSTYDLAGVWIWGISAAIGLIVLIVRYRDEIGCFLSYPIRRYQASRPKISYTQRELTKAQVAYNKAEVRKAFITSLKGKTCFRMEVTE